MGEDVELCLEVQVDPASKKILSNPDKCRSTLLDVTVVKPKEVEAFGTQRTNTLRADEVRKLITSMEKQRRKKQRVLDQLKDDNTIIKIRKHNDDFYDSHHRSRRPSPRRRERVSSKTPVDDLERKDFIGIAESVEPLFCEIRRSLKNVETRITNMQDINLVISQTTIDESASEEFGYSKYKRPSRLRAEGAKKHSIYTVGTSPYDLKKRPIYGADAVPREFKKQSVYRVETAPHDLKSVLLCQNKQKLLERGDKVEGKCLCENCGIVGLLMECQKHPLLSELSESPPVSDHRHIFNAKTKTRFNVPNFENSTTKSGQDSVYVTKLCKRVKLLEERLAAQEEKVVPKDYFKKIITKMVNNFSPKMFKSKSDTSLHCKNTKTETKTKTNSVKSSKNSPRTRHKSSHCKSTEHLSCFNTAVTYNKQKLATRNDKSTVTEDEMLYGGFIWKWGEEILKPGIDLKNRIVTLLNEILSKLSLAEGGSRETTRVREAANVERYNSEIFKKFMKHMNAKVFNAQIDPISTKFMPNEFEKREKVSNFESVFTEYTKRSREEHPEKMKAYQPTKESERFNKNVDVSYVNPKLSLWRTESPNVYKANDKVAEQKNSAMGKQEFLKIVSKAKQHQKDVLWKNIWNQARANGQNKKDKITIKIPCQSKDNKGAQKMFETEITIGEVEEILKVV